MKNIFFKKGGVFYLINSKHLLLSNRLFIEMSRKTCFTWTKEEFFIQCIVNMSVAVVAQNKTKISFFLSVDFLFFCRHKEKNFSGGINPRSPPGLLVGLQCSPDTQLYTRALCALLSVHLNSQSIKKTLFRQLVSWMKSSHELLLMVYLEH